MLGILQEQIKQIQSAILEYQALQHWNQQLINLANHHDPPPVQLQRLTQLTQRVFTFKQINV